MPASTIDFTALTHLIHFAVLPNSNGTLNASANVITAGNSASIVINAHNVGRKVLICAGGAGSTQFQTYDLSGPYPGWVTWFNALIPPSCV